LGGLSTTHIGPVSDFVRSSGPKALYDNSAQLTTARNMLTQRATYLTSLGTGGIRWYRDVQNVPWGMIEVDRDRFQFELLDTIVQTTQSVNGRYVGTVMPYAGWEFRAAGYTPTTDEQCQRLLTEDFYYLAFDQCMDRYKDEAEYLDFLGRVVERYDGDGVDDMPGLTTPIKYWQIHNEPEGDHCGLFRSDPTEFVRLMRVSYELIHASCADCFVVNGGAGIPLWRETQNPVPPGVNFWRDYANAGGAPYLDVIAIHYNQGKDPDHGNVADFEYQMRRARELLGDAKPLWVTEFGVVIGTNLGNFTGLSEKDAAAWYVRMYAAGLAGGATKFFPDAPAFIEMNGTTYLPFYVQKLLLAKLSGFTSATRVATGQYRFRVNGSDVWIVWNGMPLTGTVKATDMYGNETIAQASTLAPSELAPLILESVGSRRRAANH
ncbi:MAG TPA: hypothetical protein VMU84_00190, partial [Thermoanaerobaculia bacterium]|nr:hypothetical protein [Thermoanaerobaculia bacterium]